MFLAARVRRSQTYTRDHVSSSEVTDSTLPTGVLSRALDAQLKAIAKAKHDWEKQHDAAWTAARVRNENDALWILWSTFIKWAIATCGCYSTQQAIVGNLYTQEDDDAGSGDGSGDGTGGTKDTTGVSTAVSAMVIVVLFYAMWWVWAKIDALAMRLLGYKPVDKPATPVCKRLQRCCLELFFS